MNFSWNTFLLERKIVWYNYQHYLQAMYLFFFRKIFLNKNAVCFIFIKKINLFSNKPFCNKQYRYRNLEVVKKLIINSEFRSSSICMKLSNMILNCLFFFLQKWMFSISCARLEYLQCLKLTNKTMCINPVWLIFLCHDLILEKERKRWKRRERYNNLEIYPEGHSEPSQTSTMKFFCEIC